MYRRRRPQRAQIAFSFDSFLDVVTNVIGIIIRLILVSWVGARAYTAAMLDSATAKNNEVQEAEVALAPLPAPKAEDDPVSQDLRRAQLELRRVRDQLTRQIRELDLVDRSSKDVQNLAMSREQLLEHAKKLREEMQIVAKMPMPTKLLRYRTPVSRPVRSEEFHFECLHNRITFIDLKGFIGEIEDREKEIIKGLERNWKFEEVTSQIGDFRLRYVFARDRDALVDQFVTRSSPAPKSYFRAGLVAWKVEPAVANRGETLEQALRPQSAFAQVISRVVPQQSVVTLWVYPDSFTMFRQLRDQLHDREIEVAAWPIPFGASISASPEGSSSRGQ